jgi:hypothetical protein
MNWKDTRASMLTTYIQIMSVCIVISILIS